MRCIVGTRVIEIPYSHIAVAFRKPKRVTVYPVEIVEVECPADAEVLLPMYV